MATTTRTRTRTPASPPPQDRAAAVALLETFRSDPPGWWADNRFEQVKHFVGLAYIAINAVMDALYGSTVQVLQRKHRDRQRTTFGPGGAVAKALPTAHAQASDEAYTPIDDDDHPLTRWVTYPNEHQCFADQLAYLVMQLLLTGEQYVWAVPNQARKPVESYALPSAFTTPHLQPGVSLNYPQGAYRVQPTQLGGWGFAVGRLATNAILPAEEVKRLIKPHPYYLWSGYSPLTAGALTLDILEAIDRSRWSAMEHGAQLDAVLILSGLNDPNQLKDIHEKLMKAHAGAKNARKFGVVGLPPGQSAQGALQNFGSNVRDLDFNGGWSQVAQIVLALFGVPKGVVGLDDAENYSKLYAELRQFYHRQSNLARQQSEFFSRAFAAPWSSFPGEYKVQVDLPRPEDPELMEKQLSTDIQGDAITVNELRALRGRPPVEDGDVPPKVYEQAQQAKMAPQAAPGGAPGAEGEQPGAETGGDEGDPREHATAAALEALGVPAEGGQGGEGQQPPPVQKARVARAEGSTWQVGAKWYTKRNGKIYGTSAPGARGRMTRPNPIRPSKPGGAKPAPNETEADRVPFDRAAPKPGASGRPVARPVGKPGTPAPAAGGKPPPVPMAHYDDLAARLLRGRPGLKLLAPNAAGKLTGHDVTDGASLKQFIDKGGKLPADAYREHAAQVPAATPQAKDTLARAHEWAGQQADRHADRVAAHFGIDRARAHALLAHAITAVAKHAASGTGQATGTLKVGGKQLKLGVKQRPPVGATPTGGGPPRPTNPAGAGTGIPRVGKALGMGELAGSAGGFLVAPAGASVPKKKRGAKRALRRVLDRYKEG